jgi:hypothetical protein
LKKANNGRNSLEDQQKTDALSLEANELSLENRPFDKFVQIRELWEGNNGF